MKTKYSLRRTNRMIPCAIMALACFGGLAQAKTKKKASPPAVASGTSSTVAPAAKAPSVYSCPNKDGSFYSLTDQTKDGARCAYEKEGQGQLGKGPVFFQSGDAVLDVVGGRLLVSAQQSNRSGPTTSIFSVDLATGDRVLISGGKKSDGVEKGTGPEPGSSGATKLALVGNKLYLHNVDQLIEVDLATGNRTLVREWDALKDACQYASAAGFTIDSNKAYVSLSGWSGEGVVSLDLATKECKVITATKSNDNSNRGSGEYFMGSPSNFVVQGSTMFVYDKVRQMIVKVDIASGNRTIVTRSKNNSEDVGSGNACLGQNGAMFVGDKLVTYGVPHSDWCEPNPVTAGVVDVKTGNRSAYTSKVATGPLAKLWNQGGIREVFVHPGDAKVLVIVLNDAVAHLNTANGNSSFFSR